MILRKFPVSSTSSTRNLTRSSLGPYVVLTTVSFLQSKMSPFLGSSPPSSSMPLSYASQAASLKITSTDTSPSETGTLARALEPGFWILLAFVVPKMKEVWIYILRVIVWLSPSPVAGRRQHSEGCCHHH